MWQTIVRNNYHIGACPSVVYQNDVYYKVKNVFANGLHFVDFMIRQIKQRGYRGRAAGLLVY